jgi:hypothetical protein
MGDACSQALHDLGLAAAEGSIPTNKIEAMGT